MNFITFRRNIKREIMKGLSSILLVAVMLIAGCESEKQVNINLRYDQNESLTYEEVIDAYTQLDNAYSEARLTEIGMTDIGKPLHLFMISGDGDFDPASIRRKGRCIVFINNGIHPGEPEGIDASIQYAWDLLSGKSDNRKYLEKVVIAIIPVYNIGGALDRSEYYRMNQNGPVEKGRRRNARNMDLNRDFSKQETKNARSFASAFTYLDPEVFLDTHTTNGSDHQYTITLIPTLHSKLAGNMGPWFRDVMLPSLYKGMETNSEYGMIPYVSTFNFGDIKNGIVAYNDHPYYSTGYTSLFNCYSFMTENLVYKYFPDRVRSVIDFITELVAFTSDNAETIRSLKEEADAEVISAEKFVVEWNLDTSVSEPLLFKGYEYIRGEPVQGRRSRGYYDHEQPWEEIIPFYNKYDPGLTITKPWAYIIPQAWEDIADKLVHNGVRLYRLKEDIVLEVENYYIDSFRPSQRGTQGHRVNSDVKVHAVSQDMQYYKGDIVVMANQASNRFIVEMLEPHAPNSYFAWNYFDVIIESHDFYSVWGFESHLYELLEEDEGLSSRLDEKKAADPSFAADTEAQLRWIYEQTPFSEIEKWDKLYPVARLNSETDLPLK